MNLRWIVSGKWSLERLKGKAAIVDILESGTVRIDAADRNSIM